MNEEVACDDAITVVTNGSRNGFGRSRTLSGVTPDLHLNEMQVTDLDEIRSISSSMRSSASPPFAHADSPPDLESIKLGSFDAEDEEPEVKPVLKTFVLTERQPVKMVAVKKEVCINSFFSNYNSIAF